mmetsp:Transcript_20622/g.22906  ORF Transcript_20622/g.22906 Transcript_20622/m.22906 type:complete len:620 (+) Transcript_20622:45-1904(+)
MSNKGSRRKGKKGDPTDSLTRIAIVAKDKCKPKRCAQECRKACPVNRGGKLCIQVTQKSKQAQLSEILCIGCGICIKRCPFKAINIINLPKNLEKETTYRYGPNQFKLHRLPVPRSGQVLGLVGTNGIGKSTALKMLAGKLKPNLGRYRRDEQPDWSEILQYWRGSELQNYFTKLLEDNIKAIVKPQYVDNIPRAVKGTVEGIMTRKSKRPEKTDELIKKLDLSRVLDREIQHLSGGELQRFAIAVVCVQKAQIYMFDEPSSYLDVRQRLNAATVIRDIVDYGEQTYVIVVEHDLSVLDYLSDFVCVLYGTPGAYGVVTLPYGVREGINVFLAGFIPTENLRFRDTTLTFKISENVERSSKRHRNYSYPNMTKKMGDFTLDVEAGEFTESEIIVLVGENGTGKTTFMRLLAGLLKADDSDKELEKLHISYKPQKISPKFPGTVKDLFMKKIRSSHSHPQFVTDVIKPLQVERLYDQLVQELSGGELQRVAITLSLGQPADIYLIDEPSAYLDAEQRVTAAKVIKRFILHAKRTAFIVEHDFIMATYLADRVVTYSGTPSIHTKAHAPKDLVTGFNMFLKQLEITFRRDPNNFRPRINKSGSQKDSEQKRKGTYFYNDSK